MSRIGVMQGRLLPPSNGRLQAFPANWSEEFPRAAAAQLDCIEWIFDAESRPVNPIADAAGIDRIRTASRQHGVGVFSLCADYFMDAPLVRANDAEWATRLADLVWLLRQCQSSGIRRVVLPFVDRSNVATEAEQDAVVESLRRTRPSIEATGIEIALEMSLPPDALRTLLTRIAHPLVKVNYDSGNSAALGYDPRDEFRAYGNLISSVHIKDRIRGGPSVPLGSGDTNLPVVFECLRACGYAGDFILQIARGTDGDELEWIRQHRAMLMRYIA